MTILQPTDTIMNISIKMSEGNPGAIDAIMQIMQEHNAIDPQAVMGGISAIMSLDMLEIYGTDIYILFNDKCNRDVRKMIMLLRSFQLGFITKDKLKEMAGDQMRQIDLTADEWFDLDDKVCGKLEQFKRP